MPNQVFRFSNHLVGVHSSSLGVVIISGTVGETFIGGQSTSKVFGFSNDLVWIHPHFLDLVIILDKVGDVLMEGQSIRLGVQILTT